MGVFLERLSMWNMLYCAEQVQIQKYKTHAYKTLKTVGVQTIMLKHPTKQLKKTPNQQQQHPPKKKQTNKKQTNKQTKQTQIPYQSTHK